MLAVNPGKKYKKKFSSPRVSKLMFTTLVSQKFLFFLNKSTLKPKILRSMTPNFEFLFQFFSIFDRAQDVFTYSNKLHKHN